MEARAELKEAGDWPSALSGAIPFRIVPGFVTNSFL
jgi:hypothetical protein